MKVGWSVIWVIERDAGAGLVAALLAGVTIPCLLMICVGERQRAGNGSSWAVDWVKWRII